MGRHPGELHAEERVDSAADLKCVTSRGYNWAHMRIILLGVALLVVAGLVAPDIAPAHVRPVLDTVADVTRVVPALPDPASIAAAVPAPMPLWPLAATLALAALAPIVAAPRRALRIALVLLLAVSAVESGVHSVHHLADRQAASHCAVALATAHVQGASMEAPCATAWSKSPVGTVVVAEAVRPGSSPLRPDEGRAPPA